MLERITRLAPVLAVLLVACNSSSTNDGSVSIAAATPGIVQGGDTSVVWTLTGTGFAAGAGVAAESSAVTIANVNVVSDTQLTFELTAQNTVTASTTLMRVTNTDSSSAGYIAPVIPETVTLSASVQPILTSSCALSGCHQTAGQSPNLSDGNSHAATVDVGSNQDLKDLIEPGSPAASYLVDKVEGNPSQGSPMPLGAPSLSALELALIRAWVEAGALNN
ncbi:MAG: hypothetical protein AAFZ65_17350 [Planctomycetota bacterium]